MNTAEIPDREQRAQALDVSRSFIVQAPAGSGKTELLIQRYLSLLSLVNEPEEIIAITFTNKAAAEMRNRVLEALDKAEGEVPERSHEKITWDLARKVAAHDLERGWTLRQSPGRLRIQTIDSFCSGLTSQLPLLSAFGGKPGISDNPQELYKEAARNAISHLEQDQGWGDAVATLLRHLDSDVPKLERLLVSMLEKRDQWIRHIVSEDEEWLRRRELEQALEDIVEQALGRLADSLPRNLISEIMKHARFAADNLKADGAEKAVLACQDMQVMPSASCEDVPLWQGLANLLLTDAGGVRERLTKTEGFPTDNQNGKQFCKQMKVDFSSLLKEIQNHPVFISMLHRTRTLPAMRYTEQQWQVLRALFLFLKIALAELRLVMAEHGEVDFIEMALGANRALGSDDNPTDLAMALDYRIQHILVDEFQDTSHGQFELLRLLTRGWSPEDGRTLFVVGDPMQSIYRFREAEVGLYLRSRLEGIGGIALTPLTLSVNFRSESGIVEWINQAFSTVFPPLEDVVTGAVTYAESTAFHPAVGGPAVQVHPYRRQDDAAEAGLVMELARDALRGADNDTVAILVRNRNHLAAIIPELKQAGLAFQAVKVESLAQRPLISDLLALTRALLHPADRISWLAILRAPWCGLTLNDLHALAGADHNLSIWELLQAPERHAGLSLDGQVRLQRVVTVLEQGLRQFRRRPLRDLVEGAWLALGGAASVRHETELEEARMFFDLLEQHDHGGDIDDFAALDAALNDLYAPADVLADGRLQLMTMHGSKGLEFDHVIIPGLGKRPKPDDPRLMYWFERNTSGGGADLLLAPIKGSDAKDDPIYEYLRGLLTEKDQLEHGRLLYVAATRARKRLHLLGHTGYDLDKETPKEPIKGSLLNSLWKAHVVREQFIRIAPDVLQGNPEVDDKTATKSIRRLPPDWRLPEAEFISPIPEIVHDAPTEAMDLDILEFDWATETARHVGTLVHRYLQRIARDGLELWNEQRITAQQPSFEHALTNLGVARTELEQAKTRVKAALVATLSDERGRWVLSGQHQDARSEYALSAIRGERLVNIRVDRTFIDAEGVRWIIDYKTGAHAGPDMDEFLDRERERYRAQMERYAAVFRQMEDRQIRLGLYFPLLSGWRSWGL